MKKWYNMDAKESDVVLSTRVRIARNLEHLPFEAKITPRQSAELNGLVQGALQNINLGENVLDYYAGADINNTAAMAYIERHIVSPAFAQHMENAALLLSKDEGISIMVGEEDHIRIQVLRSGLSLEGALELANRLDDVLDETLDYAFDEELGYLTSCPTNLGTGLRASVMLHLPALELTDAISALSGTISKMGLTIRGTYGEGSKAKGSLYQISNQITLGLSEQVAVRNLEGIVSQIIAQERALRKSIVENNPETVDRIYRAFGILKYARMLGSDELHELLSNIRIGISVGLLNEITIEQVNRLEFEAGSAALMQRAGKNLPARQRDSVRAEFARELLK